jgi:hypothetical protein
MSLTQPVCREATLQPKRWQEYQAFVERGLCNQRGGKNVQPLRRTATLQQNRLQEYTTFVERRLCNQSGGKSTQLCWKAMLQPKRWQEYTTAVGRRLCNQSSGKNTHATPVFTRGPPRVCQTQGPLRVGPLGDGPQSLPKDSYERQARIRMPTARSRWYLTDFSIQSGNSRKPGPGCELPGQVRELQDVVRKLPAGFRSYRIRPKSSGEDGGS